LFFGRASHEFGEDEIEIIGFLIFVSERSLVGNILLKKFGGQTQVVSIKSDLEFF
jgi:hypothetical protein